MASTLRMIVESLSVVTVEPALFLSMFTSFMVVPAQQNLVFQKVCLREFNHTVCSSLTNRSIVPAETEKWVQIESSKWILYNNICFAIPSSIMSLVYGSWSDRISRKLPMIIPSVGGFLGAVILVLCAYFIQSHPGFLLFSQVVSGLTGGSATSGVAMFTYVSLSRNSTKQRRVSRIAILESMTMFGSTLGLFASGYVQDGLGILYAFIVIASGHLVIIIYIVVRIRDIRHDRPSGSRWELFHWTHFKDTISFCLQKRDGLKRSNINLMIFVLIISTMATSGESDVLLLYTKRHPFQWSPTTYGLFQGIKTLVAGASLILLLPLIRRVLRFSDLSLACIGLLSKIAIEYFEAFSNATSTLFIAICCYLFYGFLGAGSRSFVSKQVDDEEQGKAFAIIGCLDCLQVLIASAVFNGVYPLFLDTFPGGIFLVAVGFQTLALGALTIVGCHSVSERTSHDRQELIDPSEHIVDSIPENELCESDN